jgi:hypothetical protein
MLLCSRPPLHAAAAQAEAEKCAVIAKEVSAKQTSCEADLAAAEPLVAQVGTHPALAGFEGLQGLKNF